MSLFCLSSTPAASATACNSGIQWALGERPGTSRQYLMQLLCFGVWLFMAGLASATAQPAATNPTAHDIVQQVQDELLKTIANSRDTIETEPEAYYAAVQTVLDPVVDFHFIARVVMGGYAKQASPEQYERFTETFKGGLVSTYAKGMASFADFDIVVLPPNGDISGQRKVSVAQEVRGGENVNRVSYTMVKNRRGEWKLINVVLNGINLGKTFRSQFAQAMKKNQGDLDKVIADWSSET